MKILVVGKGVIGTIYANLFSKSGFLVYHLLRNINERTISFNLDILDKSTNNIDTGKYSFCIAHELLSDYDLIIVSVRHYQLFSVLEKFLAIEIPILIFGNVWSELSFIKSKFKNPDLVFFGMPRAGGSIFNYELKGAVLKEVILEERNLNDINYQKICKLFETSHRKIIKISKIQDWYWTHFSTTIAWICGGVKARGFIPFSQSLKAIRNALDTGKEALEIVKKRGADISVCEDIQPFLLPSWISQFIVKIVLQKEETVRISSGHGD